MDDFLKNWGYPLLFGAGLFFILKPSGSGGSSGSGTNITTQTYTYDCGALSCVDSLSIGSKRTEVLYLKVFINWVRGALMNEFNNLPAALQNELQQMNSLYPYLDVQNDVFNQDTQSQVYILTGQTSGNLLSIVQETKNQLSNYLTPSNTVMQELQTMLDEMQQTLFN